MEATGNSVAAESSNLFLDPPAGEAEAADDGSGGAVAEAPDAEQAEIGAADDQASAGWESDSEREPLDAAVVARDLLDQILQAMDVPAEVGAQRQPDGSVRLLVEGHEMGVVIGKHGSTINALQYLVGLILQKRTGERTRLVIDAEGYRNRREQALKEMALTYAQRVRESGHEAVLDALQSYERRIIHNSLADDPDVFTYSEGEEPDRRVVISPREAGEAGEE
jgi:predicted RNA-binding protein Jag